MPTQQRWIALCLIATMFTQVASANTRAPAYPLIVHDPFVSIWSASDNLTDTMPMFWGGQTLGMVGMILVDGQPYRYLGVDTFSTGKGVPAAQQTGVSVYATQTYYTFEAGGIQLQVRFATPALADDLPTWMRNPVTFIQATIASIDDSPHNVSLYFEHTAELTTNNISDLVVWQQDAPAPVPDATTLRIGTQSQRVLQTKGDRMRISWGYQYLAIPNQGSPLLPPGVTVETTGAAWNTASLAFVSGNSLPAMDNNQPRACNDDWPVLAAAWRLETVSPLTGPTTLTWLVTYDEVEGIQYFGENLPPAWTALYGANTPATIDQMIASALQNASSLLDMCVAFDERMNAAAIEVGNVSFAQLSNLAHRQVTGAISFVTAPSSPPACPGDNASDVLESGIWAFMEEMSSDGDVSTVDVLYPASPALALHSPDLLWKLMIPVLDYAANCTSIPYNKVFAPHHLGTWPIANLPPQDQEDMPMEESGNMILMAALLANLSGTVGFIRPKHWQLLDQWAAFLNSSLPLPPSQLCTDDFEGMFASHRVVHVIPCSIHVCVFYRSCPQ
jgi:hypothetical protein